MDTIYDRIHIHLLLCVIGKPHLTCYPSILVHRGKLWRGKHWRIWQMTINSLKFFQPNYFVQY